MQPLCWCTNSIGSSMVMMWPEEFVLRWSIKAASDVDFPEPVPPTKRIRPRLSMMTFFSTSGRPSCFRSGISVTIFRITMETSLRCLNILTRKRPTSGSDNARFISGLPLNSIFCLSDINSLARLSTQPGGAGSLPSAFMAPLNFAVGFAPVDKYKSEPSFSARIFK